VARWSTATIVKAVVAVVATLAALVPAATHTALPLRQQPFPDSAEYADAAWQLGHGHGYVTFVDERRGTFSRVARPPRYPFGTAVALAPFAAVISDFPHNVQVGARAISMLYVLIVVAAAWLLGGSLAAILAAIFVGTSPFADVTSGLILSDPLAAVLTVAIAICLIKPRTTLVALAGALAGALICVRLLGIVSLPALLLAIPGRRWRLIALACSLPCVLALALYQWQTFGSPFLTGYSYWVPHLHIFDPSFAVSGTPLTEGPFIIADRLHGHLLSSVCPCAVGGPMVGLTSVAFYPVVLAGLFWIFAPPLTGLVGLYELVRTRSTPASRFALATIVLNVVVVLFYFDQAARFVAPAASLLLVWSASGLSGLLERAWDTVIARRHGGRVTPGSATA
jgi:4-amino-4-deoxy-L-arabinose transferase-like glycosyltransferase